MPFIRKSLSRTISTLKGTDESFNDRPGGGDDDDGDFGDGGDMQQLDDDDDGNDEEAEGNVENGGF